MDEPPPPTHHILRPHHVGILAVFLLAFKEYDINDLPPSFVLHIMRVLLNEVSEIAQPKTFQELVQELRAGELANAEYPRSLIDALISVNNDLRTADQMTVFFHSVPSLFMEKNDDDLPAFSRRSIFGYYCRRCFLSFLKLSYSGVVKLQKDFQAWHGGDQQAGYEPVVKDQLNNGDSLIFRTQADNKIWAQPDAYEAWEKGQTTGDENIAVENLRRFFEQHFHENNDSGIRQHALLNLVRMHYVRGEYAAARKLLQEAITVSRTSGDKLALQHCISLLHRLPPTEPGKRPTLNEIQPDLHPLEVLFDVQKLMQEPNEQPLSASFERIVQAVGLYDHWADAQPTAVVEAEQWGQHAVQSIVWTAAGCDRLAGIEEDIVTAFTKAASDDNNRLTVTLNRAYKRARQGEYEEGLCMLLEPDVWRGLVFDDYVLWANEIWHILVLRAGRRGQDNLYRKFLRPRRPHGSYNPKHYFFNVTSNTKEMIRDRLYEVVQMRCYDQAASTIEQLLTALWHSEFQFRLSSYRMGMILLADIGLEFGLTKRCRKMMDEIMPQIINGADLEQRALACFTLARCIIASETSAEGLREALDYLLKAESDWKQLQMVRQLMDVRYLLSIVYHNLDMEVERDDVIQRYSSTEEEQDRLSLADVDEEAQRIWEVVSDIAAGLASR